MKLKRFISIVLSLAMVLSIVPAFSLTASAADMTDDALLSYAKGTTALFDATNPAPISTSDAAIATAYPNSGLTGTVNNGYLNVNSGPRIQCYIGSNTNGAETPNYINLPDFGAGNDWALVSFITEYTCAWGNIAWYDIDGNILTALRYGTGDGNCFAPSWGHNGWGTPYSFSNYTLSATGSVATSSSGNTQVDMLFRNYDPDGTADSGDEYYTVNFYHNGTSVCVGTYTGIGEFNGLGKIALSRGSGGSWQRISMQALKIYAGDIPASTKTITATYTVNGTTVHTDTVTTESDSASFDEYYYAPDGSSEMYYAEAQNLSDSATIAMTKIDNYSAYAIGLEFTNNGTPYKVVGTNLIPNGNFAHGLAGWLIGDGTAATSASFTVNNDGTVTSVQNAGNGGGGCLYRSWPIEAGATYAFVYDEAASSGDGSWRRFSLDNALGSTEPLVVNQATTAATQNVVVFTNSDNYAYAKIRYRWNGTDTFGNFGLYKIEVDASKVANTTIKFVDSADGTTEIKDAVTITGVVGDVIDLSAYSDAITYNGNPYSFDSSNPTSYTVVGNTDVVTLTYTTDAYVSFEGTAVTVIQGNDPVLSTTVTAKTGAGSTTVVDGAVWDSATGLSAGTHTINGTVTVEGTEISGTVEVTVLPMTFETEDLASNGTVNFPVDVTGDFYIEFDYNASNHDNMWIYASANGALWGSGQIGLGWDAAGNGYFRAQPAALTDVQFATNRTYRFLINGNVDTDTYDLTVYDTETKTVIFTCNDYGFRSGSDVINSITATSNGEGGVATLSNIKVYAPAQADLFKTYTYVVTGAGSNNGTFTTTATSAEGVVIPYFKGYILKTRAVSGTTVTYTYVETEASLGSWYMRNNFTDDLWLTEGKYLGSHNSFTSNMQASSAYVDEGGVLYGDSGAEAAKSAPSTALPVSKAQSADALDQLNAGIRYFDVRLSRQSNGEIWTRHGLISDNFRGVAATIAQWAKENPGEVIFLDFQSTYDAMYTEVISSGNNGGSVGDDNESVYNALVDLLDDTGILEFSTTNWDQIYGDITNSGTKSAIILFCKGRGASARGDIFVNRSALSGSQTYCEPSTFSSVSYSDVTSAFDSNYAGISAGAYIGVMHAYATPSALSSTSLISTGTTNNAKWIQEANFEAWMGFNNGDILLMDNATSNAAAYVAKFSSYNRAGRNYSYSANHTRTENGVTITGAQADIPYSTKWTVAATNNEQVIPIDGVEYTTKTVYQTELVQFGADSVQPTGTVTLTFPKVSDGSTTVDVLLANNAVVATANVGEAISYNTTSVGTYVLATKAAPGKTYTVNYIAGGNTIYTKTEEVAFGQEVYSVPAGDFYFEANGNAYILNSAAASSHTAASDDTTTTFDVELTMVTENAVLADTFGNNDGSNDCNNTENMLFVGSSGISVPGYADADGNAVMANNGGNVGSPRIPVLMFNVPEVADGKAVKLHLYVAKANQNLNNGSMKIAAGVTDKTVDEALGYAASEIAASTTDIVWSDTMFTAVGDATNGRREVNSWVTVDVTEFVKAATGDTITFTLYAPTAGAYVADREKTVAGGAYAGKAAYLELVDADFVETPAGATLVTKNGSDVTAYATANGGVIVPKTGSTIKVTMPAPESDKYVDTVVAYIDANGNVYDAESAFAPGTTELTAATFGLEMVTGAQVRIGEGVDENGKVSSESGLRFITTVNTSDTLPAAILDAQETGANNALASATFGVRITAEGSDSVIDIPATSYQNADKTVFTVALTNLAESNFNRKFTATPYIVIGDDEFTGTPIERSIYQVAAGLLVNANADNTEYDDEALASYSDLYKVLNAYVNQTGIRLQLNSDKTALEIYNKDTTSKYSGEAFFTVVSSELVSKNVYAITIKPVGEMTTINSYWKEYIRINNNNSQIAAYTSMVDNGDGTVTITFDYASFLAK